MRLLLLTIDWPPIEGGIATLAVGTARALAERGHQVDVLAPRVGPAGAEITEPAGRIAVTRFPGYGLSLARVVPFAAAAVTRLGGHHGVLALNPAYGGAVAALARGCGGPPYVAWAYGLELLKARGTPLAPLYRRVFAGAHGAFAISRYTRDLLVAIGVPREHVRVVPPGVEPLPADISPDDEISAATGAGGESRIVLTVGRLIARKGHAVLLEAMAEVMARRPDVVWVVAGRGPCQADLERRARALGIASRVRFLGHVEANLLAGLYRRAAVFALTPRAAAADAEGFGIVYLEAGLGGVPVVASRTGGVEDAVSDGASGLLVPPDDAAAAAGAIGRLLDDRALAARLGAGGRRRAQASGWSATARAVEEALGARAAPAPPEAAA